MLDIELELDIEGVPSEYDDFFASIADENSGTSVA